MIPEPPLPSSRPCYVLREASPPLSASVLTSRTGHFRWLTATASKCLIPNTQRNIDQIVLRTQKEMATSITDEL